MLFWGFLGDDFWRVSRGVVLGFWGLGMVASGEFIRNLWFFFWGMLYRFSLGYVDFVDDLVYGRFVEVGGVGFEVRGFFVIYLCLY